MALEKSYNGRVSSKKNGVFFSGNQSYMGISALPTEESAKLQPLYVAHTNPSSFLAKFPKILVTLQDDGSVEDIQRDVVFVDANGETHSATDVMSAHASTPSNDDEDDEDVS